MGYSIDSLNYIIDGLKSIASRVDSFDEFFGRLSILKSAIENSGKNRYKNAVVLTTIHSSKAWVWQSIYDWPGGRAISVIKKHKRLQGRQRRFDGGRGPAFLCGCYQSKKVPWAYNFSKVNNKPVSVSRFVHRFNLVQKQTESRALPNEICEGAILEHVKFGQGLVTRIDESKDLIVIEFEGVEQRCFP